MSTEMDGKGLSVVQKKLMEQKQLKQRVAQARSERAKINLSKSGRAKGAKGKATIFKEAVLAKTEHILMSEWEDVVETTIELAKGGDTSCLKILWDKIVPSVQAIDTAGNSIDKKNITINISGLEVKALVREEDVVEADFVEVKDGSS